MESLLSWVSQVDKMTDNINEWNTYLDDFVNTFDTNIQETVATTLTEWQESGFLHDIISNALQTQMDDLEEQMNQMARNKLDKGKVKRSELDRSSDSNKWDMNDFNEQTRQAILQSSNIDIDYVLGSDSVTQENIAPGAVGREELDNNFSIKLPYLADDTENLDYVWEQGNYIVNKAVKNNPFGMGCTLEVQRFKTSLNTPGTWITQTVTTYDVGDYGDRGLMAKRLFYVIEDSGDIRYASDWKGLGDDIYIYLDGAEYDLDTVWDSGRYIVNGEVLNNPFGVGTTLKIETFKTRPTNTNKWVTQIAISYDGSYRGSMATRILYVNEETEEIHYQSEWKEHEEKTQKHFYLSDEEEDLDEVRTPGYYMVNEHVQNNPFGEGCTMVVEIFNTGEANEWVTQELTTYGGSDKGRNAKRLIMFNRHGEIQYQSDWKFYGGVTGGGGSTTGGRKIKALFIGNSFSLNATEYIHHICASENADATIGVLYISGGALSEHWENVEGEKTPYTYHLRVIEEGTQNYTTHSGYTVDQALESDDWEYVIFNQSSGNSGVYDSFYPYLDNLIAHVESKVPGVKIGFMPTWAYFSDFDDPNYGFHSPERFEKYGNDQLTMYNAINETYLQIMEDQEFSLIIPSGTAIQNARTSDYMKGLDYELTRDGYHLNNTGMFIASVTLYQALFKTKMKTDYRPSGVTSKGAYLGHVAVTNAINKPFNVTDI